ncbi:MAG: oxidoreductase [Ilumatobacteraceae bacterium]
MAFWSTADIPDLEGHTALVTGANSGLGLEVTRELARCGAAVTLACRSEAKATDAIAMLRRDGITAPLEFLQLDLADLASVASAAAAVRDGGGLLHLLVNNAGLMAIDHAATVDGFEMQFGVNHLGHFALTAELLPVLDATPGARIATMSSMGHRAGSMHFDDLMFEHRYDRWRPYFQSKLANLLFTAELHRRLGLAGSSTMALAAHPGGSRTDLGSEGKGISNTVMRTLAPIGLQSPRRGAEPMLRALTDRAARGAQFYGPRWMTRGHAVLETPSRKARSPDDARRLWEMSEQLTSRVVLPA